ncbi:DUF11 domain-containing protein [Catellatospora tritici]|uniref:DUF11 domain-containing protein n=1 Tax=Catellatospora tritici TaxID=2851566 RepID=UPI001C2D3A60|nr:DUF11 domain-containing protein [Catellatospora tritici]MBV1853381.1 DUF11 domain-containing protein [Catellatospora tritici]
MRLRTIGALLGALLLGALAPAAASGAGALTLSAMRGTVEINEYEVSVVGIVADNHTGAAIRDAAVVVDASQVSSSVEVMHMLQDCARAGKVFTCRTSVAAGDFAQFQLVVQAHQGAGKGPAGQVTVTAPGSTPIKVGLQVIRPQLADIQTTSDRQVGSVGQTVPVTIVVHNAGPDSSYRPTVFVYEADGLDFQGFAACPGTLEEGGCMLPTLTAGKSLAVVAKIKITGKDPSGTYGVRTSTADPNTANAGLLDVCVRGGYCTNGRRYGVQAAPSGGAASPKPQATATATTSAAPAPAEPGTPSGTGTGAAPAASEHAVAAPDLEPMAVRGPAEGLPAMLAFGLVFTVVVVASVQVARTFRPGRDR